LSDYAAVPQPIICRAADGSLVLFGHSEPSLGLDLGQLITEGRAQGVDAIWVSGEAIDTSLGFERAGGYARFEATSVMLPIELPSPPPTVLRDLRIGCYKGIWGRCEPTVVDSAAISIGLHEGTEWIGVCEVDEGRRRIVAPGVRQGFRTPDRYARLVRGAAARLGSDPLTLETWGDSDETLVAYEKLGFAMVEYVPGWRLDLGARSGTLPT
jgi:hypothetical protein